MQELEKILEEIDDIYVDEIGCGVECNLEERTNLLCDNCYECIKETCKDIIRKHMNDGWIPVAELLPEDNTDVLITYADTETGELFLGIANYGYAYFGGNRLDYKEWRSSFLYFRGNYEVIAWRPLPDPYRPERSEK